METIQELRDHCVKFGGFTGGWNVILEFFKEAGGAAVSVPTQPSSWLTKQFEAAKLGRVVEIGHGLVVVVIGWDDLVKRVKCDALRERLLVSITGNLSHDDYVKAVKFSGRTDGLIRRSMVGVPVGAPYWCPTEEQLAKV